MEDRVSNGALVEVMAATRRHGIQRLEHRKYQENLGLVSRDQIASISIASARPFSVLL